MIGFTEPCLASRGDTHSNPLAKMSDGAVVGG